MGVGRWFGRSAWREFIVDLRRAPRDARSRTKLRRTAYLLLLILYQVAFQVFAFNAADTRFEAILSLQFNVLLFGSVAGYAWWSERREARLVEQQSPSVSKHVKIAIFREACLLGTLLERAASERNLEKELPPGVTVITRRVMIDRLRADGQFQTLEPHLRTLLLAPDGHWTESQKRRGEGTCERVAVFHWVLGMGELVPLTLSPEYSVGMIQRIVSVKDPTSLKVLASWDVRPERNLANEYFTRCWVELVTRGMVDVDADIVEEAALIKNEMRLENPLGDYLAGINSVEELSVDSLWQVTIRAYRRWQILSELVDVLCEDQPVGELRKMTLEIFSDVVDSTTETATATPDQTASE